MAGAILKHVVVDRIQLQSGERLRHLAQRLRHEILLPVKLPLLVQSERHQAHAADRNAFQHGRERAEQHHPVARAHVRAARRNRSGVQKHREPDRPRVVPGTIARRAAQRDIGNRAGRYRHFDQTLAAAQPRYDIPLFPADAARIVEHFPGDMVAALAHQPGASGLPHHFIARHVRQPESSGEVDWASAASRRCDAGQKSPAVPRPGVLIHGDSHHVAGPKAKTEVQQRFEGNHVASQAGLPGLGLEVPQRG